MRLLVLPTNRAYVIAVRDAADLSAVLADVRYAGADLAVTDADAFEGLPPPPAERMRTVDRADPTVPSFGAQALVDYAAARRYAIETGGLALPDGSVVRTDRESQGLIDRAVALASQDKDALIDFKTTSGWVTVDAPTMLTIGVAVGRHVRSSFARERQADAAIAAGTATSMADVDRILAGG